MRGNQILKRIKKKLLAMLLTASLILVNGVSPCLAETAEGQEEIKVEETIAAVTAEEVGVVETTEMAAGLAENGPGVTAAVLEENRTEEAISAVTEGNPAATTEAVTEEIQTEVTTEAVTAEIPEEATEAASEEIQVEETTEAAEEKTTAKETTEVTAEDPPAEVTTEATAEETPAEETTEAAEEETTAKETTEVTAEDPPAEVTTEATAEETTAEETTEAATVETQEEETTEENVEESTEESFEETSEEMTEESIPEDDIEAILSGPMLLDLGDVTSIMEITSCKISGDSVVIDGKINTRFTTWNKEFYLFEEEMYENGIDSESEPIATIDQSETFRFTVPLNNNTAENRLYSKFFVGVKFRNGDYHALSNGRFITNPEALAANQSAFPTAYSKKGLHAEAYWGADIDELGISHVTVNVLVNDLLDGSGVPYAYNGNSYEFSASYLEYLDTTLTTLQKNNVVVTAILLVRPGAGSDDFSFPGISESVGSYHGWNVVTQEGIECVSAVLHFLGERYGRSDNAYGHISNWIVSNEVNADTSWNYTGHQPVEEYALIYANMLRITYQAVKSSCAHARVYMPLDMFWNNSANSQRYDGKKMVDLVNQYMKAEGDIFWGIAFHPYANPLTEVEWWNDHAEQSETAGFISMKNLSVLTNYMQKAQLRDPDGNVKKIILSEQGYTSHSASQGNVEWKQAAAYAYAYYVTEANPYIQAFIAMRQKDAALEYQYGLYQGMWYDNTNKDLFTFAKKPAWTVWKYIDTAHSFDYTDSLASLVGLSSFSGIYGTVMSSKNRTETKGTGGYADAFNGANALELNWTPQYLVKDFSSNGNSVTVEAGTNSPYAYTGIVWNGKLDFSEKSIFGFQFAGTAGENQNLRVRMRFTSGKSVYETEIPVQKNVSQILYADLSAWNGKSNVTEIQIWVQQDGTETWQNGSFTVSDFCMATEISKQETPSIQIVDASAKNVSVSGFDVSCNVSGTEKPARVDICAWNIVSGAESAVTQTGVITGNTATAHFSTASFGGKTGAYKVKMIAYTSEGIASEEYLLDVTIKGITEALVISNIYATDISTSGFTLKVEASSDHGMAASKVGVWSTQNGQDDLVWYPITFANGVATVHISTANHKNNGGEYACHAYVKDNAGVQKIIAISATVPSSLPEITSASVTNVSALGYTVTCTFRCPNGISHVEMPTWTENEWQDDLIWHQAAVSGNTATFYVKTSEHKEEAGHYFTHIYVRDKAGNYVIRNVEVDIPEDTEKEKLVPEITNLKISDVTSSGYRVTVTIKSPAGISEVTMPTWTKKNDQDDLIWHKATVTGNTATFYVNAADHKNESGTYVTHVYVRDMLRQQASKETSITVPAPPAAPEKKLQIKGISITELTSSGYRVTAEIEAPNGVKEVTMPTWTVKNGQDDLIWHKATVSGNKATFYVPVSSHKNEKGTYITHVYLYDKSGKHVLDGTEIQVPASSGGGTSGGSTTSGKLQIKSITISDLTSKGYRVTAEIEAPNGVKEVTMPTWTIKNGQDDLIWHQATVSGNKATFYVPVSSHKNETGRYMTHVYLYDKTGKYVLDGKEISVPNKESDSSSEENDSSSGSASGTLQIKSIKISELTSKGYRVTAELEAPAGVKEVTMPTWTVKNGQDDLIWHKASISGNKATFYVSASSHKNETGTYTTHVYLYDKAGKHVIDGTNVTVPSTGGSSSSSSGIPTIKSVKATEVSSNGYRVTVEFSAPAGVKQVQMPSWSVRNGQDDLIWHVAKVSGNTATFYVPVSSHKGNKGEYLTHVYVYDKTGAFALEGISVNVK